MSCNFNVGKFYCEFVFCNLMLKWQKRFKQHIQIGRFSTCSSNHAAYRFIEKHRGLSPLAARCDLSKISVHYCHLLQKLVAICNSLLEKLLWLSRVQSLFSTLILLDTFTLFSTLILLTWLNTLNLFSTLVLFST